MAARRTRVVLSIPWDDEDQEHPATWGFDVLLGNEWPEPVVLIDFVEVEATHDHQQDLPGFSAG